MDHYYYTEQYGFDEHMEGMWWPQHGILGEQLPRRYRPESLTEQTRSLETDAIVSK